MSLQKRLRRIRDAVYGGVIKPSRVEADEADVGSLDTEQAQATDETLVRFKRDDGSASIGAGTYINCFDGVKKDNRGEVSSGQFTPDKDGQYDVSIAPNIGGNTAEGDTLVGRVRDVDAGNTPGPIIELQATDAFSNTVYSYTVELEAGTTYELQVTNRNSDFKVLSGANTSGIIRRSVVQ
jgi:hypothetical protein